MSVGTDIISSYKNLWAYIRQLFEFLGALEVKPISFDAPSDTRRSVILRCAVTLLLLLLMAILPANAKADYTPTQLSYYADDDLGAGGTYVSNDGTNLSVSNAASTWNSWTGYYQLVYGSSNGCGYSVTCIIFVNDGSTITGTDCYIDSVESYVGETAAATTLLIGQSDGYACFGFGYSMAVFAVVYDNEQSFSDTGKAHIARHEIGHALQLNEHSGGCWTEGWGSGQKPYPLMHHNLSNCPDFITNIYSTSNEAYYAALWAYF